jgi:hypothetical protein
LFSKASTYAFSGAVEMKPSPIFPASSAASGAVAAMKISGGSSGKVYTRAWSTM